MGLPGTESSPLDAWISPQGTDPFLPPYPHHTAGPTVSPRQTKLGGQDATHGSSGHIPPPLTRRARNLFKRFAEFFISLHAASTAASFLHSAPLRCNRHSRQKKQCPYANCFWTTWHPRKKLSSPTKRATWSSQSTVTPPTYPNPKLAAAQGDTCSCQQTTTYQQIMVPFSISRKSSEQSCHPQRRPNSEPYL